MASDDDRAAVLRHRWRADLRALNGDTFGAELQRRLADASEAYHAAKTEGTDTDRYQRALVDLEEIRGFFRTWASRADSHAPTASVLNDFAEPSDAELLAGAS